MVSSATTRDKGLCPHPLTFHSSLPTNYMYTHAAHVLPFKLATKCSIQRRAPLLLELNTTCDNNRTQLAHVE
jgi:hypothetical protein